MISPQAKNHIFVGILLDFLLLVLVTCSKAGLSIPPGGRGGLESLLPKSLDPGFLLPKSPMVCSSPVSERALNKV